MPSHHSSTPPVRWGILGAGAIAARFARDLVHVPGASVGAVFARRPEKAQAFCDSLPHAAGARITADLDQFLSAPIDAVYVATLPDTHHHFSRAALLAGHPVLCEKPVTRSLAELDSLLALAADRRLLFMEAMKTPFLPVYRQMREELESGQLHTGPVQFVQAGNAAAHTPPDHPSWRVSAAGGALLSIGVYQAFLAVDHLGPAIEVQSLSRSASAPPAAPPLRRRDPDYRRLTSAPGTPEPGASEPSSLSPRPSQFDSHNDDQHRSSSLAPHPVSHLSATESATAGASSAVDAFTLVQTRHSAGFAQLYAGLELSSPGVATLFGPEGYVVLHKPWWNPSRATVHALDGRTRDLHSPVLGDGLHYEAAYFSSLLDASALESPIVSHAHSRAVMLLLDQARAAIGLRFGELPSPSA